MFRLCYKFHKILGSLLSILFLMWFLSGFVMIYHNFPKLLPEQQFSGLTPVDTTFVTAIDSLLSEVPRSAFNSFSLRSNINGEPLVIYRTENTHRIISPNESFTHFPFCELNAYASRLNRAEIVQVDTLRQKDRWLTYDKYEADFPVYKFYFNDPLRSELYVSSLTGEGLQYTNSESRFWAWMGAIPHWLYIANLRHHTSTWKTTVIALSGIGSLVCLSGIAVAIRLFLQQYRVRKRIGSPYKKPLYKWHHIIGFIFGLFVFTFAFSGMMSLQKIPQWLIKTKRPEIVEQCNTHTVTTAPLCYPLSYKRVLSTFNGSVQKIEWSTFADKPYYKVIIQDSLHYIDASITDSITQLSLSEDDVRHRISALHTEKYTVEWMNEYDNHYIHKRMKLPLPVYRITVDDTDKSLYYINPYTAETKYFNANTKARKWVYQALHSFSVKWLLDHPLLWHILMWSTMIGGTVISITGVVLGIRYLRRKCRR